MKNSGSVIFMYSNKFNVVGDADTRLGFPMSGQAVVEIAAQPRIDGPISFGD